MDDHSCRYNWQRARSLVGERWSKIAERSEAIVGIQLGSRLRASIEIEAKGIDRDRAGIPS